MTPIILFVYNRLDHTKLTLESLKKNDLSSKSELFVFSDGAKNESDKEKVKEVRKVIAELKGFKKINIFENSTNKGLANSVIDGVTSVFNNYDKAIVLEDDLMFSTDYLAFMNNSLDYYRDNERISSISGYSFPIPIPKNYKHDVLISYRTSSWAWATWKDRWNKVDWEIKDFDEFKVDKKLQGEFNRGGEDLTPMLLKQKMGKIDSWAIRWAYFHYKTNTYCLYPVRSKANNIGMDNSGRHSSSSKKYFTQISEGSIKLEKALELNDEIIENTKSFFSISPYRKLKNKIQMGI